MNATDGAVSSADTTLKILLECLHYGKRWGWDVLDGCYVYRAFREGVEEVFGGCERK